MSEKASKVEADLAQQLQAVNHALASTESSAVQLAGGVQSGFVSTGGVEIGGNANFGNTSVASGSSRAASATEEKGGGASHPAITASELELLKKLKKAFSLGLSISDNDAEAYYDVLEKLGFGFAKSGADYVISTNHGTAFSKQQGIAELDKLIKQIGATAEKASMSSTARSAGAGVQVGGNVSQGFVTTADTHIGGNANFGNTLQ